jgi:hypothetical protein
MTASDAVSHDQIGGYGYIGDEVTPLAGRLSHESARQGVAQSPNIAGSVAKGINNAITASTISSRRSILGLFLGSSMCPSPNVLVHLMIEY